MAVLMFNQTLEILHGENKGMWRVVSPATSQLDSHTLIYIPESIAQWKKKREVNQPKLKWLWLPVDELREMVLNEEIKFIALNPHPVLRKSGSEFTGKHKEIRDAREKIMQRLINPMELQASFRDKGSIYQLVREAMQRCSVSKKHVYELFSRLSWYGFELGSLNPQFYKCGAPGVARPWSESMPKVGARPRALRLGAISHDPQIGMTADTKSMVINFFKRHKDPAKSFEKQYVDFIKAKYVKEYVMTDEGRLPIDPPQGSFPNKRQVRYALVTGISVMERLAMKLHKKEFIRDHRGLTGHSWQKVAGPGHMYMMDATIADIYLRSQINPAWSIGRPIIYFILDTWSTAIVAFHICLSGPSWDSAKVALFNMLNPELAAELWGVKFKQCLFPLPELPYHLMSDRGEYLSKRAAESGKELGFNQAVNPAYEPDKKGLVEAFNKIAKDKQYGSIPGAIDARRKAIEARTNPADAVFTMRKYYEFVQNWVNEYNLHADKSYRLTHEMIAKEIRPTPAEIWKYGFEEMMGYGKEVSFPKSVIHLLPRAKAAVTKKGIYLRQLEYRCPEKNDWAAIARNIGSFEIDVYYFPGAVELVFYCSPESSEVITFSLSPHARTSPHISHDEWLDSLAYSKIRNGDHAYMALMARLQSSVHTSDLVKQARDEVKAAKLYELPKLSTKEARALELDTHAGVMVESVSEAAMLEQSVDNLDVWKAAYNDLMGEIFNDDRKLAGDANDE